MTVPTPPSPFPLARIGGLVGTFALTVFPLFDDLAGRDTGCGLRLVEIVLRDGMGEFGWLVIPVVFALALFIAAMVLPARHRSLRGVGLAAAAVMGVLLFGIHRFAMEQPVRAAWGAYAGVAAAILVALDGWMAPRVSAPGMQPYPVDSDAPVRALVESLTRSPLKSGATKEPSEK